MSKSSANGRQEEHSQLQARTPPGRTVAANEPKGSSLRKGRSQDTVRQVTSIEDASEDKRDNNANESVPVIVSTRTVTAVNPRQQFHMDADATEPIVSKGTRRKQSDAAVATHDSQSDKVVITIQIIGCNVESAEYMTLKGAALR